MTPHEFITRWQNTSRKERSAAQAHFIDLCRLLDEPTPAEADPDGADYDFEYGAAKTTGGRGFADVFKRGHFGWEYKGTHGNLDAAFAQLQRYAVALDNPPLLIVSDIGTTIRIHTNWTNSVSHTYVIPVAELGDAQKRGWLKAALSDPEALRPKKTRQELTEEVAGDFAELARSLRQRGHAAEEVAHFVNKLIFCMFAEDVKLLPDTLFTRMLDRAIEDPTEFEDFARDLFGAMRKGGRVGFEKVAWFNGGLFNDDRVFLLTKDEIKIVRKAAGQYWGDIDPSILGTLFERGLDPEKRSQLGAHYTDHEKIMMIVRPVVVDPLAAEWETAKAEIAALMEKATHARLGTRIKGGRGGAATKAEASAQAILKSYLKRLGDFRVLDPACGSGNFLYIALRELKDLELRAQVEAETLGLPRGFPSIGPEVVRGIELNPYAAELARVSVWIGEIQWSLRNGFPPPSNPILKPLDTIECRDALLDKSGAEAKWPDANAIVGNPPFLGDKVMVRELGEDYTRAVRAAYSGRVPGGADFVLFWVSKGLEALQGGGTSRVGFVTTNSVRGGANRKVLDRIAEGPGFVAVWDDEPWTVEGAAVRVSMIAYGKRSSGEIPLLDGKPVSRINADLSASEVDLTKAYQLKENANIAFIGNQKSGSFEIDGEEARRLLKLPSNPNGHQNADVLRPWINGMDVVRRPSDKWIIDFGPECSLQEAALYAAPFCHVEREVKPERLARKRSYGNAWWLHERPRPALRRAITNLNRYIVTPRVAKHRLFLFASKTTVPDSRLVAIARDDDTTFGILISHYHELWSLRTGGWHGVGNDPQYNAISCFETFPFPEGLTPNVLASSYADDPRAHAIAVAAAHLNKLRENWLNPDDLVHREPEVVRGYPDRILPVSAEAAKMLQKRTLTNLYNERPAWLDHAHSALDAAVATAYGWPVDLPDDEVLARLFTINQERAVKQGAKRLPTDALELEEVE
ncbi:class I SAM-dependent DNA methyltransferase [Aureimonas psammosilenae]|uniref:class I SAM-dependent DNA methyltransferase n=1 Tax=Aureimonas psammosilenae TaxID=2495496 RepID=UPI0012613AC3|nr:class I SAM-dependent DNA methyltransferase [Aureimonas psammosilenae]